MAFRAKDFLIGWELAKDANEEGRKNQLREGLKKLDEQQIEEVKTPQAADPNTEQSKMLAAQNEGLTNELPPTPVVTGYQYGDQTFKYKPPAELISALKADRRAALFEQHGDIDKAQVLREAAVKQRATAIQGIMDRAVRSGRLEDMFAGYSLIDDGYDASFERGKDGSITAYWWDQANPDKRSVAFTAANEQEARQRIMDMMDPELSSKLADAETNRALRQAQIQNMEETRGLRQDYNSERLMIQKQQQLQQQANYWTEVANRATSEGEYVQAMQQRDTAMRLLSGIGGSAPGSAQDLGSAQGLSKNTTQWRPVVEDATRNLRYVTPDLALAVIQQESNGNATAMSPAGAIGLMQLMPGTARDLGVSNPYDPIANIRGGVRYLDDLVARYDGDVQKGLMAYNWGMGNVDKHLAGQSTGVPRETQNYVPGVMSRFGGAPQQGLTTSPNATAAAPAADPRFMRIAEARREAARMPKPGKEPSVAEMIQLRNAAIEELGTTLESIKKPEERQRLISQKMDEIRGDIGAGGYDAVGSMGQIANGTAKDNAGGLTGSDFATVSKAAATGVRKGVNDSALAKEQAKFDQRVQSHANSLRALESTKASNPEEAKRQAQAALADIEGLYPNLTAAGKQAAATALNGIYRLFPELAPQP